MKAEAEVVDEENGDASAPVSSKCHQLAAVTGMVLSCSFIAVFAIMTKLLLERELDPFVFNTHRQIIAVAIMLPLAWGIDGPQTPPREHWLSVLGLSICQVTNLAGFLIGLAMTNAIAATVMQLTIPGLALIFNWALRGDKPSRKGVSMTLVAVGGCLLAVLGSAAPGSPADPLPLLLPLLPPPSSPSWATSLPREHYTRNEDASPQQMAQPPTPPDAPSLLRNAVPSYGVQAKAGVEAVNRTAGPLPAKNTKPPLSLPSAMFPSSFSISPPPSADHPSSLAASPAAHGAPQPHLPGDWPRVESDGTAAEGRRLRLPTQWGDHGTIAAAHVAPAATPRHIGVLNVHRYITPEAPSLAAAHPSSHHRALWHGWVRAMGPLPRLSATSASELARRLGLTRAEKLPRRLRLLNRQELSSPVRCVMDQVEDGRVRIM